MLHYPDFIELVRENKIMLFAENSFGMPSLEEMTEGNPWFTGLEDDPWIWKNRIAQDRFALYGHFYSGRLAFCAREFIPVLLYTIAPENDLEYRYETGEITPLHRKIAENLKGRGGVRKDELRKSTGETAASRFERVLESMEGDLIVCISGQSRRISKKGVPYGWQVNEFSLVEEYFPECIQAASELGSVRAHEELYAMLKKHHACWPGVYDLHEESKEEK